MTSFVVYLLCVSICLVSFYFFYWLCLRSSTYFHLNRFILVGGLMVSFIVPQIVIPVSNEDVPLTAIAVSVVSEAQISVVPKIKAMSAFNIEDSIMLVYAAGVVWMLGRLAVSVIRIARMKKRSAKILFSGLPVYVHEANPVFSAFGNVFIPDTNISDEMLAHERVHVKQMHAFDLMVTELASALLWFNPLMIFYKRAIKLQHEFLADAGAILKTKGLDSYLNALLEEVCRENKLQLTSSFYSNFTKKRILMMTKTKSPLGKLFVYALIIPLICVLLLAFSKREYLAVNASSATAVPSVQALAPLQDAVPEISPIDVSKLKSVSKFGQRFHPVFKVVREHTGVDFTMDEGNSVMATADGVVIEAGFDQAYGNHVSIKHSTHIVTKYYHCKEITVHTGDQVKKGQVIGTVGSTGISVGNHLHYEVIVDDKPVNPKDYLPQIPGC